jgi:hypothetical protein
MDMQNVQASAALVLLLPPPPPPPAPEGQGSHFISPMLGPLDVFLVLSLRIISSVCAQAE